MFIAPILIFAPDDGLRTALTFSLELEGFRIEDGGSEIAGASTAGCLIVDQGVGREGGLAFLARLRQADCVAPAILLATNPTRRMREKAAAIGVRIIEKPLLCNTLTSALHCIMNNSKAA